MSRQRFLDETYFRMAANGDKGAARLLYRKAAGVQSKDTVATALAHYKEQAARESSNAANAVRQKLEDMVQQFQLSDAVALAATKPEPSE